MTLIVYADVDCPDCCLAARRVSALVAAGVPVDWRAVQRRPDRPVTGVRLRPSEQDALARRFDQLRAMLLPDEVLPYTTTPTLAPNTAAAVSAVAEAYGTAVADDVRRVLVDLYWAQGADIGDPNVLRTPLSGPMLRAGSGSDSMRQVGYAVSVNRGPITTEAYRRVDAWQREWRQLGSPELPVVLVDGAMLVGTDAVRRLGKEIAYRGAEVEPQLADPLRYPAVDGAPSPEWVSWCGGRWRNVYKGAARELAVRGGGGHV